MSIVILYFRLEQYVMDMRSHKADCSPLCDY